MNRDQQDAAGHHEMLFLKKHIDHKYLHRGM